PAPIYLLSHLQSPPLPPASPCIPHRHTVSHALDPRRPPSTPPTISSRPHPKRSTPFPQFSPLGGNFRYSSVVSSAILEKCDSEINNYICAAFPVNYGVSREPVFAEVTERCFLLTSKAMKLVTKLKKKHRIVNTEAAILVLDHELQMLRLESMSIRTGYLPASHGGLLDLPIGK
ncbi:hypothetical protein LINGRAHAP2_LOCUS2717, partial [Linum grandiflorum]